MSTATILEKNYPITNSILDKFVPRITKYIPHTPTVKQQLFLLLTCKDAFYGGAAGGGKSDALLMAALQYVDIPGYNALIIRDSYQNLTKPEALIPRSAEWLGKSDARWNGETKTWTFPSGATLSFGYLAGPLDHFNFQSAAYQFIGIDECVAVRENQALYLFSRLRKLKTHEWIPLRFRCASNPPTREQLATGAWVAPRYVDEKTRKKDVIFIPAKMRDNPYLDQDSYEESLMELDPVTRAQLKEGDWKIRPEGRIFQAYWFRYIDTMPAETDVVSTCRFWDLAATEPSTNNKEPAYTASCRMHKTKSGQYIISSVTRDRKDPLYVEQLVQQIAYMDSTKVPVYIEQEGGSAGKITISHFRRNVLSEFVFSGELTNGKSKLQRAGPFSSQAEAGNIILLRAHWNNDFINEAVEFPDGKFKDQIDSASGAFNKLAKPSQGIRIRRA